MRYFFLLAISLLLALTGICGPKKVILDTDMDSDIDDVAALALLHHYAAIGKVEILATVSCSSDRYSVQLINAINTYYGRPDIPVGIPKEGAPKHSWILEGAKLAGIYNHSATWENSLSAVKVYRKLLAEQADSSVTIISIGYLNNLYDLLNSEPDEYSPLKGIDLVALKVDSYFCMGGSYPSDDVPKTIKYGNFRPDPFSTDYVLQNWPTLICFTGGGDFAESIQHGNGLKYLSEDDITRKAYELAKGDKETDWSHHSADILTVWIAVNGAAPFFHETMTGYNEVDEYGRNTWILEKDNPKHIQISELNKDIQPEEVSAVFNQYLKKLTGPIKRNE